MSSKIETPGLMHSRSTLTTAPLPRRVRRVLEQLFSLISDEFARDLDRLLGEFDHELLLLAERARNPALQSGYMDMLGRLRKNRAELIPHFLVGLETGLAQIRGPDVASGPGSGTLLLPDAGSLRLVEDNEIDEEAALRMIAVRHESRASLPLLLLGQRFGVLAGKPAFDAGQLPVGPYRLSHLLAAAARSLQVNLDARLLLYRLFDRHLGSAYSALAEAMNLLLIRENVLPGLSYVPLRSRPRADSTGTERAATESAVPAVFGDAPGAGSDPGSRSEGKLREASGTRPGLAPRAGAPPSSRPGQAVTAPSRRGSDTAHGNDAEMFASLQQLLTERRGLVEKLRSRGKAPSQAPVSLRTDDVIAALGSLQSQRRTTPSSLPDIRQTLLAQSRQQRGEAAALSREDDDTFELLDLLYAEIGRELRDDTPSTALLQRLQVPLLRLALQDRGFFVRNQHPARQLLNAVAESGANWTSEDEADPQLQDQLHSMVEHVVEHFDGDAAVFEAANQSLQQHLQRMARKAEVSERRHVEAARGKDKLELAKRDALQAIEAIVADRRLPRFLQALLSQAWADVLTLVLLRHGEQSDEWREHQAATVQIVAIGMHERSAEPDLAARIEEGLALVGYHGEEAAAIARRLTSGNESDDATEDPASRTELAMKLKARTRLGPEDTPAAPEIAPRTEREQAFYQQVRSLPFGSWIEFVRNQQGDVVRRRLAWFSLVTDRALFVNQRGQRVDEQTIDHVARLMAAGQARIVTPERARLVDSAWSKALSSLRKLANRDGKPEDTR